MKKNRFFLILLAALAAAGVTVDQITAVRASMPPVREGDPSPARPQPEDRVFSRTPFAATYEERREQYLEWAIQQATPPDRGGLTVDLLKLEAGAIPQPSQAMLDATLEFVNNREDPSDFAVTSLVRLYYLHHADGKLAPVQEEAVRRALLDYKYWLDELGPGLTEMWTENHQILSHGSEYLAGQMFPDEVFTNDGKTGREHMEKARAKLLRWIDYHARTGMAEWDSIPYYNMDLAGLLNLVEFAEDPEIQTRATMMVDLLLFDTLVDSFYGQDATSHGRATAGTVRSAAGDSLCTFQALMFGTCRIQGADMASTMLVTGRKYALPPVLAAIAQDHPEELLNYERHSIPMTEEAEATYGLSFTNINDIDFWWGMGAFTHPKTINLTVKTAETYQLWEYPDFKDLKDIGRALKPLGLLPIATQLLKPDANGVIMSEVNKVSYRTPDAVLSTAQDYRPGEMGYQQHIWQATLGPYAVVFSTNPDSVRSDDRHRPSYWASNGRLPRTAQYRNVLVSVFNLGRHPSLMEARHFGFTHAYFPRWAFDEVLEVPTESGGGWIFGRSGDGYVALYSHQPYEWIESGPDSGQEIAAPGLTNVWIAQIGRKAVDGTFAEFVERISRADLQVNGLEVVFEAPGTGTVQFGWKGPLEVNGREISLRDYPRWDNPYAQAEFGSAVFEIRLGMDSLALDFEKGTRDIR